MLATFLFSCNTHNHPKAQIILSILTVIGLSLIHISKVYKLATLTTLKRARRSMDQVSRHDENPKVASVVYPIMQTVDTVSYTHLDVYKRQH